MESCAVVTSSANRGKVRRSAIWLGGLAAVMFGLGFAAAPLYSLYCRITGTQSPAVAAGPATSVQVGRNGPDMPGRLVTVRFDANIAAGLPWKFGPAVKRMEVRLGESVEAKYMVSNLAAETIIGQAIPNVIPGPANPYFNKTECFCFREQSLSAGESREMPVRFFISRELPLDIDAVTLSYTFMNRDVESARRYSGQQLARRVESTAGVPATPALLRKPS